MGEAHDEIKPQDSAFSAKISNYIAIARPDHWFKNIFVLPGFLVAVYIAEDIDITRALLVLALGIAATCLIASANYTINEWLDAEFDRQHPTKKKRPSAQGLIVGELVWVQWAVLSVAGLGLSLAIGTGFFACAALLLVMGLLYNVNPIRTKDRVYLDVLSESLNNPIRFMLGWTVVLGSTLPPSSILLAYWMGGAFLMAIKRFAEFRFIDDQALAGRYRVSFKYYTEHSLLASSFFYALTCSFLLGVFLVKYRIEYLLLMPFVAMLFTGYLWIGLRRDSVAQRPEKLYTEKKYVLFIAIMCLSFALLSVLDIPWLNLFLEPTLIE